MASLETIIKKAAERINEKQPQTSMGSAKIAIMTYLEEFGTVHIAENERLDQLRSVLTDFMRIELDPTELKIRVSPTTFKTIMECRRLLNVDLHAVKKVDEDFNDAEWCTNCKFSNRAGGNTVVCRYVAPASLAKTLGLTDQYECTPKDVAFDWSCSAFERKS